MLSSSNHLWWRPILFFLLIISINLSITSARRNFFHNNKPASQQQQEQIIDPYKVLGLKHTASNDDIQKAYRKKARETHPDKNPSPNATNEFRQVTDAYDILGTPTSRKKYDTKRRADEQRKHRQEQQKQQEELRKQQQYMREQQIKQRKHNDLLHKSKVTSSRMMKVSSLDEFTTQFTTMENKKRRVYNTHILLLFVGNKHIEKKATEEYYFPYPFTGEIQAGKANNNNQYEDILKVVKVRYNTETELTRLFHIPNRSTNNNPYIIFVKKGDTLGRYQKFIPPRHYSRTQSSIDLHNEYIKWVKSQLTVQISIGNRYSLPVIIFIIRNGNQIIHDNDVLNTNYQRTLNNIQVGDHIYAFDKRLDLYQGTNNRQQRTSVSNYILAKTKSILLLDEIVTSTKHEYTISSHRKCYDLSTSCYELTHTTMNGQMNKQCIMNPEFYHNICPYTCGICTSTNNNNIYQDVIYMIYHKPIHTIQPRLLQRLVMLVREISIDIENIVRLRKNSAVTFFGFGLLLAFNVLLYKSGSTSTTSSSRESGSRDDSSNNNNKTIQTNNNNIYNTLYEVTFILLALNISIAFYWFNQTNRIGLPFISLQTFHRNLSSIITNRYDLFKLILGSGIVSGTYARYLLCWFGTGSLLDDILMIIILVILMGVRITIMHYMKSYNKYFGIQYNQIWLYNKNVLLVVFIIGCVVGIGLISLWRVISKSSIRKKVSLPLVLLNVIVVSIVGSLALMDTHFTNDILHVLELRKNAAFGFTLLGIISGMFVVEVVNFITWTPVDDIMRVNGVVPTQLSLRPSSQPPPSNGYKEKEEHYHEEEQEEYEYGENEEHLYGDKEKYE